MIKTSRTRVPEWRYDRDTSIRRLDNGHTTEIVYSLYRGPDRIGYVYDIVMAGRLVDTMNAAEEAAEAARADLARHSG